MKPDRVDQSDDDVDVEPEELVVGVDEDVEDVDEDSLLVLVPVDAAESLVEPDLRPDDRLSVL
jgi:hypothetical protein